MSGPKTASRDYDADADDPEPLCIKPRKRRWYHNPKNVFYVLVAIAIAFPILIIALGYDPMIYFVALAVSFIVSGGLARR